VLVLAGSDLFNAKLPYVREGEAGSRGGSSSECPPNQHSRQLSTESCPMG